MLLSQPQIAYELKLIEAGGGGLKKYHKYKVYLLMDYITVKTLPYDKYNKLT